MRIAHIDPRFFSLCPPEREYWAEAEIIVDELAYMILSQWQSSSSRAVW